MDEKAFITPQEVKNPLDRVTIMRAMGGLWGGNIDFINNDGDIVPVEEADGFCVTHPDKEVREAIWRLSYIYVNDEKAFYCDARRQDDVLCFLNFIKEKDQLYLWLGAQRKLVIWMVEDCDKEQATAFINATKTPYDEKCTKKDEAIFEKIMKKTM